MRIGSQRHLKLMAEEPGSPGSTGVASRGLPNDEEEQDDHRVRRAGPVEAPGLNWMEFCRPSALP